MACEILIKTNVHGDGTVNYTHPVPEKDRSGVYKKGYPVTIREYPHSGWGFKEGLPYFVLVRVTDAAVAEVEALINTNFSIPSITSSWVRNVDWEQTAEVASIDGHRMKMWTPNSGSTNLAGVTRDMVENYLNKWNAYVFSTTTNEVVFDVAIFEDDRGSVIAGALQSEGFWNFNVSQIAFSEETYVEDSGNHRVTADYSALQGYIDNPGRTTRSVQLKVEERGGIIISNVGGVVQFDITRSDVFDVFKRDVKLRLENTIYRRQLRVSEATVDNIISNGIETHIVHQKGDVEYRHVEITLSQLQSYIINRLDEAL